MNEAAPLRVEVDGPLARITLTRPDLLNRVDDDLHHALRAALEDMSDHRDVRAIILASTGKVFSAGGDFALMERSHHDPHARRLTIDQGRRLLQTLLDVPQPVVVGLQGAAVGLGATIALAGDIIVAARTAFLSDPHVQVGLVAGDGGTVLWPSSAGIHTAKRHLLTGDRMSAEDAFRAGMVSEIVDGPDEVNVACEAWAVRMAALAPLAVQGTKRALNQVLKSRMQEVSDLAFTLEAASMASPDHLAAVRAFTGRSAGVDRTEDA